MSGDSNGGRIPKADPTREVITPEDVAVCSECGGDGWWVGHDEECYRSGDCGCSGVQIRCHVCFGSGVLNRV